jgi:tetratricopeptide (TPR) repeat protein
MEYRADYFIQIKQSNSEPDFQLVKSQLFKALNSFHPANDKEALANIHAALFYRFLDEKKLDSALLQGKIAEGYYDDLNKREEAFQIMLDKIAAYAGIDNKEALQNEEFHAIDYITNTTDKRTRAHLYEQMGFNYDLIRRRSSMIQCFLKAKELWEELDDKKGQINAWHQLGVYQVQGEEKAVNYFLKELSIRKEIKDSFEINETYSILTYACIGLGRLEDAENYVLLAKNSIEHNANPFVQARLLDAEGQLLQAKKMYPEAISKFKQAAELFSKTGFVVHLSYQYYHLAKCHQAMGNSR